MRVAMIGTGYVGLVSGACLADFGHHVTCVDKDAAKIAALRRRDIPIYEPDLDRIVETNAREGRLDFTTDLHGGNTDYQFTWQQISLININTQMASYTITISDYNTWIEMNVTSVNNLTIPLNASVAFPIGTLVYVVQIGAGQTTLVATGGVTLLSSGSAVNLAGQYASCTLYKRATDTWVAMGNLV
jgi:hypothetical protein